MAAKTPMVLLLGLGAALVLWARDCARRGRAASARLAPIMVAAATHFALVTFVGFNIGHRHLLPVVPFVIVLVASVVVPWAAARPRLLGAVVAVLVGGQLVGTLLVAPHFLAYFNALVGGPDRGHRILVDSNLDWGQELPALRRYLDAEGIDRVWLAYFGTASPEQHGITCEYLPSYAPLGPSARVRPELLNQPSCPELPGTVVISATMLHGPYLPLLGLPTDWFARYRDRRPDAVIGHSLFVYSERAP